MAMLMVFHQYFGWIEDFFQVDSISQIIFAFLHFLIEVLEKLLEPNIDLPRDLIFDDWRDVPIVEKFQPLAVKAIHALWLTSHLSRMVDSNIRRVVELVHALIRTSIKHLYLVGVKISVASISLLNWQMMARASRQVLVLWLRFCIFLWLGCIESKSMVLLLL